MAKAPPTGDGGGEAAMAEAPAAANGSGIGSSVAWGAVGAIAGAAGTLLTGLNIKQLININPYMGMAVLALVAAFIVLIAGLVARRTADPVVLLAAVLLMVFGGGSAYLAPKYVDISLLASAEMTEEPPIKVLGVNSVALKWNEAAPYRVREADLVGLNVAPIKEYYRERLANCVSVLKAESSERLGVGTTDGGY